MKIYIFIIIIAIALTSCTKSPENQAIENIEKFIIAKMDDPKSFESVSFGKLEKTKSSIDDDDKYYTLIKEELYIDSMATESYNNAMTFTHENTIKSATESYVRLKKLLQSQIQEVKEYENKFKPVDIYKIKHSFRAKTRWVH